MSVGDNFTYQELSLLKCYFRTLVFISLEKNDKFQEPIRWNLNLPQKSMDSILSRVDEYTERFLEKVWVADRGRSQ